MFTLDYNWNIDFCGGDKFSSVVEFDFAVIFSYGFTLVHSVYDFLFLFFVFSFHVKWAICSV